MSIFNDEYKQELLQRFIRNECTAEEMKRVAEWLEADPGLPERLLPEIEWLLEPHPLHFPVDITEKIDRQVFAQTGIQSCEGSSMETEDKRRRRARLTVIGQRMAWMTIIAASFFLAVVAGWQLFRGMRSPGATAGLPGASVATTGLSGAQDTIIQNQLKTDRQLRLPDGSMVVLGPGSRLRLPLSFGDKMRSMEIEGRGLFDVAKDPRPFTVLAGHTATTALGTRFRIDYPGKTGTADVRIQLLQGKVVVREHAAVDNTGSAAVKTAFKSVYLLPGEELIYSQGAALVQHISAERGVLSSQAPSLAKDAGGIRGKIDHALDFSNQPLPAVLKKLEQHFAIHVIYNEQSLKEILFTGDFTGSEDPEEILSAISRLNNLSLQKKGSDYMISPGGAKP